MKLKNEIFAGHYVVTGYGNIEFDADGFAKQELTDEQIESLGALKGFEVVHESVAKKEVKAKEVNEEKAPEEETEKPKRKRKSADKE